MYMLVWNQTDSLIGCNKINSAHDERKKERNGGWMQRFLEKYKKSTFARSSEKLPRLICIYNQFATRQIC